MLFKTPKILSNLYPSLLWTKESSEKVIYLTFDDGPIPDVTEFVLNTLASYHAKATFFCIGDNIKKYPDVLKKVLAGGHAIGNHTMYHKNGWKTSVSEYIKEVELCTAEIEKYTNSALFRPPYGRIKTAQIRKLKRDYEIVAWSVLTQDYDQRISKEDCLEKSIKATDAGSIVLFHDSLKAQKNMEYALPRFLAYFSEKGYTFEALA